MLKLFIPYTPNISNMKTQFMSDVDKSLGDMRTTYSVLDAFNYFETNTESRKDSLNTIYSKKIN